MDQSAPDVRFVPIGDIGADAGGARPHIQIQSILWHRHLLGARRGASVEASLPLWPRKAQLTLGAKYVAVQACDPLTPARGDIEVTDGGLDVWRDAVPV